MKFKAFTSTVVLFACFITMASAQDDYESFSKRAQEGYANFRTQKTESYESFRRKANAEYADFLRQAWKSYNAFQGDAIPKEEQTPNPPVIYKGERKSLAPVQSKPIEVVTVPSPTPKVQPQPIAPIPAPQVLPQQKKYWEIPLYGISLRMLQAEIPSFQLPSVSENHVASAWSQLSDHGCDLLLSEVLRLRKEHSLCDWAYLQMLHAVSKKAFSSDRNKATMLMAYLYCQSGYRMKFASADECLYMLFASEHNIMQRPYWKVDGQKFYAFDCEVNRLKISSAGFVKDQPLSLHITGTLRLPEQLSEPRKLVSKGVYALEVESVTDRTLIDFYNHYPSSSVGDAFMTRWAMYANTPLGTSARNRLYPQLRAAISGKETREAVSILLNFMHTAFVYEYDNKVWGGDRAFFPEETLFYPYSDCEDRSILFSLLVRDLLGLDCALVYYPGHLATAVALPESQVQGDYFVLGGRKFVVCDPCYINASVGMTMPKMNNSEAKLYILEARK